MQGLQRSTPCGGNTFLFSFILICIFAIICWLFYLLISSEPAGQKYKARELEPELQQTILQNLKLKNELLTQDQLNSQLRQQVKHLMNNRQDNTERLQLSLAEKNKTTNYKETQELKSLRQKLAQAEKSLSIKQQELDKLFNHLAQSRLQSDQQVIEIKNREIELAHLKKQLSNTGIKISDLKNRFTVFEMKQEILFNEGEASLNQNGQKTISDLAKIFRQFPERQIAIQGHTDNQAVGKSLQKKFTSNWELAAARSASAIHYLQNIEKIKPQRMILVSYSQYRPLKSNSTIQGQANNRRIEIILMPVDFDFFRETT